MHEPQQQAKVFLGLAFSLDLAPALEELVVPFSKDEAVN